MTETASIDSGTPGTDDRHAFLRDAAVFHAKLIVDGLRDLVLFPVALVAAGIDLFKREDASGRRFYAVVHFGKQTEDWIDLFEAAERAPETDHPRPTIGAASFDELADQLERKIREEYEEGDLSASARRAIDQIVAAAQRAASAAKADGARERDDDPRDGQPASRRSEQQHEDVRDERGQEAQAEEPGEPNDEERREVPGERDGERRE